MGESSRYRSPSTLEYDPEAHCIQTSGEEPPAPSTISQRQLIAQAVAYTPYSTSHKQTVAHHFESAEVNDSNTAHVAESKVPVHQCPHVLTHQERLSTAQLCTEYSLMHLQQTSGGDVSPTICFNTLSHINTKLDYTMRLTRTTPDIAFVPPGSVWSVCWVLSTKTEGQTRSCAATLFTKHTPYVLKAAYLRAS